MANHKSALKRIRSNETKRNRNRLQHKPTRNAIKDLKQSSKRDERKKDMKNISECAHTSLGPSRILGTE